VGGDVDRGAQTVSGVETPSVVVRGDRGLDDVVDAVERAGGVVVARTEADTTVDTLRASGAIDATPDAVVAVDEAALLVARDDAAVPVLPVDAGVGHHSLPRSAVERAIEAIQSDDAWTVEHPVVTVSVDSEFAGRALTDVTLMTSEPARISEYAVSDATERIDTFRADGVVAATPMGSNGYARAVGGPVLAPETGLAVVPISPYATLSDSWVLRSPLSLTVERDDADVSLILDDTVVRRVPAHVPVALERTDSVSVLRVPGMGGHPHP
jgi:NAD+ kinase